MDIYLPGRAQVKLINGRAPIYLDDQDSVMAHWDRGLQENTWDLRGDLPADYYTRPIYDLFAGLEGELKDEVMNRLNRPGFYRDLEPIPGAVEAARKMVELGITVYVCTSPWLPSPTCMQEKVEWLDRHVGPGWNARAILTRDKTLVYGDVLVDDKPKIVGALENPFWEHIVFQQRYNLDTPGRRLVSWENWESVLLEGALTNAKEFAAV